MDRDYIFIRRTLDERGLGHYTAQFDKMAVNLEADSMIPFQFNKKSSAEQRRCVENYSSLLLARANKKKIEEIDDWCRMNLSRRFSTVITASYKELRELKEKLEARIGQELVNCAIAMPAGTEGSVKTHQYVAEGGDVQQLIRATENKKPVGFNFQIALKKVISRIFDSSEGEIRDIFYGIEVTIYKANGKLQNFYAEIESDKVKDYGWLKGATNSLAKLPRTKDDKEVLDNMIQECIESEYAKTEWIYNRAGWRNITGKGWSYIFHDGIVGTKGTQIYTGGNFNGNRICSAGFCGSNDVFRIAQRSRALHENGTVDCACFCHCIHCGRRYPRDIFRQ